MRYPDFLKENGSIGIIAPSFGCTVEPYGTLFGEAVSFFRSLGYDCIEGPNCRRSDGIGKSTSAEKCAAEINNFFIDGRSDVIISCGGGETMCEDLSYVDFEGIKKAVPKWFMGYSDNTNLVFTLPVLCDTAAVYGQHFPTFGQKPLHESLCDAIGLLKGEKLKFRNYAEWEKESLKSAEKPFVTFNCTEKYSSFLGGSAAGKTETAFSGRLIGGCLDILSILCGTRFDKTAEFAGRYREDGTVWFLESCDFTSVGARRALWGMKEAGWFEGCRGFIIGRPNLYDDESFGQSVNGAFAEILGGMGVPIVFNADIGHRPPSMPIIAGAFAEVTASADRLEINHILK